MPKVKAVVKQKRSVPVLLAIFMILVGAVTYFLVGPAVSVDHMSYKQYVAAIPYAFDTETLSALSDAVNRVSGTPAEVEVANNEQTGNSTLIIKVVPAGDIDEQKVVTMLADEYAEMEIETFTSSVFAPAFSSRSLSTMVLLYTVVAAVTFILCSFIVDVRGALNILIATVIATLMACALYVVCRVPFLRMLIAAIALICIATPYLGLIRLRRLKNFYDQMKKPSIEAAVNDERGKSLPAQADLLIVCAILCAAIAVVGLIKAALPISYFGVMLFVAGICVLYVSNFFVPTLWLVFHTKRSS